MPMGNDHQMTIIVRISVHHHKGMLPSIQDEIVSVSLTTRFKAEDALLLFPLQNVIHSPRSPKMFHGLSLWCIERAWIRFSELSIFPFFSVKPVAGIDGLVTGNRIHVSL